MRTVPYLFAISIVGLLYGAAATAQPARSDFKPGEWKIDSVVTMSNGKSMTSTSQVCANNANDVWKQHQPNLTCSPLQVTPESGGFRVQLDCKGGAGPVTWTMHSDELTILSAPGTSYKTTGTTTSSTVLPGRPPMVITAKIQARGTRIGPCSSAAKP
jgi:hypothetical protein